MKTSFILFLPTALLFTSLVPAGEDGSLDKRREAAYRKAEDGLYREAWGLFVPLILDRENPYTVADFDAAVQTAEALDQPELAEELIETVFRERLDDTALAATAAWTLAERLPHDGVILDGEFVRSRRERGKYAQVNERDRARAVLAMLAAEKIALEKGEESRAVLPEFYRLFADIVSGVRNGRDSWLFTAKTVLDPLPEPDVEYAFYRRRGMGAPVDENGEPIFYPVPGSWDEAENDGQRWRWLLSRQAAYGGREDVNNADMVYAEFLLGQFGVQTLLDYPLSRPARSGNDAGADDDPFAVRTLGENETLARLATGIRRFTLPDEHNHIAIFRRVHANPPYSAWEACRELAKIFENRQQYEKAAAFWRAALEDHPEDREAAEGLENIVANRGMFEAVPNQPAGKPARIPYVFRNGDGVRLTAYRLNEDAFIRLIKDRIRSGAYDGYNSIRPEDLARQIVEGGKRRFIGEKVAEWSETLSPLPGHYSRRSYLEMPFTEAGAYLVVAEMRDGNSSRIAFWQSDLALVEKTLGKSKFHYVADAVTGAPAPGAKLTFFGFDVEYRDGKPTVKSGQFAAFADDDGMLMQEAEKFNFQQWLIQAETDDGKRAYLGFAPMGGSEGGRSPDSRPGVHVIVDRPVFKPGETAHFKIWAGYRSYASDAPLPAGTPVTVRIYDPMGDAVYEKTLVTDDYGGVEDQLPLGESAVLGAYRLAASCLKGSNDLVFRLEEYKVPEFEVAVECADESARLGDTVKAAIKAKYYFGSPVANARVSYRVTRTIHAVSPFPPSPWDWLYGDSYWGGGYEQPWLPGWNKWGRRILPPGPGRYSPPEVVMEGEGVLDENGVLTVSIDTAPALEAFGDRDHRYEINAEIVDSSRRTVVGSGSVVAARNPVVVSIRLDRGFYSAGDDAVLSVRAQTPLANGLAVSGVLTLYRIRYDARGGSSEEKVESWPLDADPDGDAALRFHAGRPGQYRLAYVAKAPSIPGAEAESAVVFSIRGDGEEAGDFRYNALELIADKRQYAPGDRLELMVNSQNPAGFVLLFVRTGDGQKNPADKPTLLRLQNGSSLDALTVGPDDQPNFFCEAITVFDGKMHAETREIIVPPEEKTLDVQVVPDSLRHLPGGKAEFTVTVAGPDGRSVSGQAVAAVYDKAVEYIAGGDAVPDIRSAFWSWKRTLSRRQRTSLSRSGRTLGKRDEKEWRPIGVFGRQEMDWNQEREAGDEEIEFADAMPVLFMEAAAPMAGMANDAAPRAMPRMAMATAAAGGEAEPTVRRDFAGTALWLANLDVGADGTASFVVDLPDNLTTWKTRVWVKTSGTRVGEAATETVTAKNIVVRPQSPRFLTQTDEVVLSANVHNYLPRAKTGTAEIRLEGGVLELLDAAGAAKSFTLPRDGETRLDWRARALRPGVAVLVFRAVTDEESDAAEVRLPVAVHGSRRVESHAAVLRPDRNAAAFVLDVPAERLAERSRLEFVFAPTLATALLDALPYLFDYPYGCTEQTLNRFLPAVMTRTYLKSLGLSLADADLSAGNHPHSRRDDAARPVADDAGLDRIALEGISRLADMQNADGGWGWFSGVNEVSWPHTTAVVVHGLLAARANGLPIPTDVVESGVAWLSDRQSREIQLLKNHVAKTRDAVKKEHADDLDAFTYMILAGEGGFNPDMRDFLYRDRLELSLSGLAMFGLALHRENASNALDMVLRNLEQFVERNPENHSAWLRLPADGWWWWYNDEIETAAWYLKLLSRVDPKGDDAAAFAKYLIENRKNASYWRSTRDTAYAVEAIVDYALASGEARQEQTVRVYYDGKQVMERVLSASDLLRRNAFTLEGPAVETGRHEVRIEREGGGNLYIGGRLDLFTLVDPIPAAAGDLKIARTFYKLTREDASVSARSASGREVKTPVLRYSREKLPSPFEASDLPRLRPGDLVEVELTIEAANDYEYLCFEDMKAAGLEAVELRSGYANDSLGAYVEYRDDKVVLFVRYLPRGKYNLGYRFRAETPGSFSALPAAGGGMYATELVANSDEMKLEVAEDDDR